MITKTKERTWEWNFQYGAVAADVTTFKAWENYQITPNEAGYRIKRNNGWCEQPTREEFIQMANGFGYHRGIEETTGAKIWDL